MALTRPQIAKPLRGLLPVLVASVLASTVDLEAQTLRGGQASLDRQNQQAQAHNFTYLRTPDEVRRFVELGYLVPVRPSRDFDVHNVSFPYARPEVRVFIERLASQYRAACGEKLVVTSLTRPISNQPANASVRSVHPTGMALDLRRPTNTRCRNWLESTLLSLEARGLVEAIYERNPPHYHVAVYPRPYIQYVAQITGNAQLAADVSESPAGEGIRMEIVSHLVSRGETLSAIATRYGTTVTRLRSENGLRSNTIMVGQTLRIPVYRESVPAPVAQVASANAEVQALDVGADEAGASATQARSEAPAQAPTTTHRVAGGESLWTISRRYGVSEAALRAENGISGSRILVGQQLRIPASSTVAPGTLLQHRVARGESLWSIARQYGTTVEEIRNRNGMDTTRLQAGQVLEVPLSR